MWQIWDLGVYYVHVNMGGNIGVHMGINISGHIGVNIDVNMMNIIRKHGCQYGRKYGNKHEWTIDVNIGLNVFVKQLCNNMFK
jgi:hypothetical protein